MKARIQENKLIYRLQSKDIALLETEKYCQVKLSIGNRYIVFQLQSLPIAEASISWKADTLLVTLTEANTLSLIDTGAMEIEFKIGETIVVVEKDFKEFHHYAKG